MPCPRRLVWSLPLAVVVIGACGGSSHPTATATVDSAATGSGAHPAAAGVDWTRFGYDAARTNDAPQGISAARVRRLSAHRVRIGGTVDSSPIFFAHVRVRGRTRGLLVMTTTYGKTLGLDAASGRTLWAFTPRSYRSVAGTAQITTATPVADPSRRYAYAASPDGVIHKLNVSTGREIRARNWPVSVTRNPHREKIASALNIDGRFVLVTTGGYIGDAPPYQGKVVAIDRTTGRIAHVLNSLCSNRRRIINPSSCPAQTSAIWGRAGAVVDPVNHRIYVATGNGPFNGRTDWGDSVLELSPGAGRLLRHYTPRNQRALGDSDTDLGSTSPVLLPAPNGGAATRYLIEVGKDGMVRLLSVRSSLFTVSGAPGRHLGGEVQDVRVGGGVFAAPAVLHRPGLTEVFITTFGSTYAFKLGGGRLHPAWQHSSGGTSPVIAGGLLWVYDPGGGLNVYRPSDGARIRHMSAPSGHWNSPIVAGGRVYLPSGNSNDHATSGALTIFR